jgi:amidase
MNFHEPTHEPLQHATLAELQDALSAGDLTSVDLVQYYMERIARHNLEGRRINAVLELNPDALHIAQAMDVEREQKRMRGPLHGIPILLKDNLDTGDRMHTSAGSIALADSYAARDASLVRQLRQNGAVILGKTNMTEFAHFMATEMPNGYSSRGGQVRNPYGAQFDVGGSSSGSAAAVAADFAPFAVGTETSASIISPAQHNSLVGIKPTVGLISRSGIIPLTHSQDTAGPIARTVRDAAIALSAMTEVDAEDPATGMHFQHGQDYTLSLDPNGLHGARIGVIRHPYWQDLSTDQEQLIEDALRVMQKQGAQIIDNIDFPSTTETFDQNVMLYEFKANINAYLGRLPATSRVRTLRDVIDFNERHAEKALRYGQDLLIKAEETSGTLTESIYIDSRMRDMRLSRTEGFDRIMYEHRLDAIFFPGKKGAEMTNRAGYPAITVPGGYTSHGEPLGVTLTGMAFSESMLIQLAFAYEQATLHRVDPFRSSN